jgi:hypothetical protein
MHLSFNLWKIKGLYMFGALLAHPQEVLNKRYWELKQPISVKCFGVPVK